MGPYKFSVPENLIDARQDVEHFFFYKKDLGIKKTSNRTKHLNKNENYNEIIEMPFGLKRPNIHLLPVPQRHALVLHCCWCWPVHLTEDAPCGAHMSSEEPDDQSGFVRANASSLTRSREYPRDPVEDINEERVVLYTLVGTPSVPQYKMF